MIEERLTKLRKAVPNMNIADVIVGFPGETQEMFENSYKLIDKIGFSGLHIFQIKNAFSIFEDKIIQK